MSDMKVLVGKLNGTCHQAMELAASLCVSQTNFNVEIEHLLSCLLDQSDTDLSRLMRHYEVDGGQLKRDLDNAVARFKRGNGRTPALSPHVPLLLEEAWKVSSLELESGSIRSASIAIACLRHETLRGLILESAPGLLKIPSSALEDIQAIVAQSAEDSPAGTGTTDGAGHPPVFESGASAGGSARALDQYTVDLVAEANAGKIDPIRGRDREIRQIIDILMRRRQNNPILTGEAGVGKTAVVEGFARKVALGHVPPALRDISLRMLDLGLLQAGAGVRGEFEDRLKGVITEVKASPTPTILFIDEAHTLIGAGALPGQSDAANLLKPALARGELRTIAATTWSEYKKYFEKDPALARRFQVIKVEEPDEQSAVDILRGIASNLEQHHEVRILDEALHDAVKLSSRYISGRHLPDKAISVIDTACARVRIAQRGTPPAVEAVASELARLRAEIASLKHEEVTGIGHGERLEELSEQLEDCDEAWTNIEARWQKESALVERCLEMHTKLTEHVGTHGREDEDYAWMLAELSDFEHELVDFQGDEPLVPLWVDNHAVASVISGWTGIPMGRMVTDEIHAVLSLREEMAKRIIGQPQALDAISRRIHTYRADMDEPGKPVGVFLLVGPSGVGKTETAVTLAEVLYGGERTMISINLSEYQEAHTISGLKGAPPGYVGFGTGGVLTEGVRHNPYSVILLDEIEKAHRDVIELFYQVFDKGILEDAEGQIVDFKNTVVFLTSNMGTDLIVQACAESRKRPSAEALEKVIRPELVRRFKPALLGRMVVVPYYPLGDDEIREIVGLKLAKVQQRFRDNHRAELTFDDRIAEFIAARCTQVESGARNIDHILTHSFLPGLSAEILDHMARHEEFTSVDASLGKAGKFVYRFSTSETDTVASTAATGKL
jgi:type VI secretion system protein VasG